MSNKNKIDIRNIINSNTDINSDSDSDFNYDSHKKIKGGSKKITNDENNLDTQNDTDDNATTGDATNDNIDKNVTAENLTEDNATVENEMQDNATVENETQDNAADNITQETDINAVNLTDDLEGVDNDNESKNIMVSNMETITIKRGTILYHSSYVKDTFDPIKINLNKGKKYLSAYFSTNRKIASARIKDCTKYPQKQGYIHTFEVKNDIDNIYLLSQYDLSEWNLKRIEDKYCNSSNNDGDKYNGVGFYILGEKKNNENSEYALCNPKRYLKYINTIKCKSYGEYSGEYRFDEKNTI